LRRLAPRVVTVAAGDPRPPGLAEGTLLLFQLPHPDGRFVFGDGSHPTTRLCAAAVDQLCRERQRASVLDVGTGTGVLARIARARGALEISGTDIDAASVELARSNAALDGAQVPIHFGAEPPDHWGARFELVVANILEQPLRDLAAALTAALRPEGLLLISGFTALQAPRLRVVFEARGLRCARDAQLDGWTLLLFDRDPESR
jgi:ribosomal protein L11 methyltransferase